VSKVLLVKQMCHSAAELRVYDDSVTQDSNSRLWNV